MNASWHGGMKFRFLNSSHVLSVVSILWMKFSLLPPLALLPSYVMFFVTCPPLDTSRVEVTMCQQSFCYPFSGLTLSLRQTTCPKLAVKLVVKGKAKLCIAVCMCIASGGVVRSLCSGRWRVQIAFAAAGVCVALFVSNFSQGLNCSVYHAFM